MYGEGVSVAFLKRIRREHLEPNLRVGPVIVGGCKVKTRGTNDRGRGISMSVRLSPWQPEEKKGVS